MSEIGRRSLEALGLSPYEARILFALLRNGPSNSSQLARVADVPRTSTYAVLEVLSGLGLARRQDSDGPAVWSAPHPDEVLERLEMATNDSNDQELRQYRQRVAEARRLLADAFPSPASVTLPYVHIIRGAGQETKVFEQLVSNAERELLIFDCPAKPANHVVAHPVVAAAVARGVAVRMLCDTAGGFGSIGGVPVPGSGIDALSAVLPISMTVADGKAAMIGMRGPINEEHPGTVLPTTLLVENVELAGALVHAFERFWTKAQPGVGELRSSVAAPPEVA